MAAYFVTIPLTLTEQQRHTAEAAGWTIAADLRSDVMAGAVPTTTLEVSQDSPEQAVSDVADAFDLPPDELRVEAR